MDKSNLDQLRIERKPEKKHSKIPWLWALAILVILIAVIWFVWITPPAMIEVRTVVVREMGNQPAGTVLNASGYVTARRQATVSSKLTGRVTEVLIEEGMLVEQAQVLARLDDSNVRANFELVKAQLVSAQRGLPVRSRHNWNARKRTWKLQPGRWTFTGNNWKTPSSALLLPGWWWRRTHSPAKWFHRFPPVGDLLEPGSAPS
jgi:biotin carboxyl carrier protein